ncbi:MAG: type II toxin-antitoxin system HicA family toxin [Gammaproteobacteria bacterium]
MVRKLQRAGFEVDHITGSHYIMRHPDGRRPVVPYHAGQDKKLPAMVLNNGLGQ